MRVCIFIIWFVEIVWSFRSLAADLGNWQHSITIWGESFKTAFRAQPFNLNAIAVDEFGDTSQGSSVRRLPRWVAIGDDGKIVYSSGYGWNVTQTPTTADLISVHVNDGKWIVTGSEGVLLFSDNGGTWEQVHSQSSVQYVDAAWDETRWMVVGSEVNDADSLSQLNSWFAQSVNGLEWNAFPYPNHQFRSVASNGDGWIVAGHTFAEDGRMVATLLRSKDGLDWTPIEIDIIRNRNNASLSHISIGNGEWIVAMEQKLLDGGSFTSILRSSDLRFWKEVLILSGTVSKPAYANQEWTFCHQPELHSSNWPTTTEIYHSRDGSSWKVIESVPTTVLTGRSVASTLKERVLVGRSGPASILTAPRFTQISRKMPFVPIDVEENSGKWIAVDKTGKMAVRINGQEWSNVRTDTEPNFMRISTANGIWIAMSIQGEWWRSVDGSTWTKILSHPTVSFTDLKYGGGKWVASGKKRGTLEITLFISDNLSEWRQLDLNRSAAFVRIGYGNGIWIMREVSTLLTSLDAMNWEVIPRDHIKPYPGWDFPFVLFGNHDSLSIVFGGGNWITAGYEGFHELGMVFLSEDGLNWQAIARTSCDWIKHEGGIWWAQCGYKLFSGGTFPFCLYSRDGSVWSVFDEQVRRESLMMRQNVVHQFTRSTEISHVAGLPPLPSERLPFGITTIAHSDNHWLAVDEKTVWISSDGINWMPQLDTPSQIHSVAFGQDQWAMLGTVTTVSSGVSEPFLVLYTYRNDTGFKEEYRLPNLTPKDLVFAFEKWWSITENAIYTTSNGVATSLIHDVSNDLEDEESLQGMAFSDQMVIVFSDKGSVFRSNLSNGFSKWEFQRAADDISLQPELSGSIYTDLIWADGQWLMAGGFPDGKHSKIIIQSSKDGIRWTSQLIGAESEGSLFPVRMAHSNNQWLVAGSNQETETLELFESIDGNKWTHLTTIQSNKAEPVGFSYAHQQWLLAMSDGTIHRSGPDLWLSMTTNPKNGRPQLIASGRANESFQIRTSRDVKRWRNWRTIQSSPQPVVLDLPPLEESSHSFFSIGPVSSGPKAVGGGAVGVVPQNTN